MHSGHFCLRAGVLGYCVCLTLSPNFASLFSQKGSSARQEGVKSSLFEAPGWGRASASNHRPPAVPFPYSS